MSINDPKTIFQTALTDVKTAAQGDVEQVGTIRHGQDGKIYRWVKNTHTVALAVGQVVFHDGATDTTNMYKYVEDGETDVLPFMAGVAISAIPINGFGWIIVEGVQDTISTYASGGTAIAVGDSLIGVDSTTYVSYGTTAAAAPVYSKYIIALETLASSVSAATEMAGIVNCF